MSEEPSVRGVVDNLLGSRRQNTRLLMYFPMNNALDLAFDLWASQAKIIHCYWQPILVQSWVRWLT